MQVLRILLSGIFILGGSIGVLVLQHALSNGGIHLLVNPLSLDPANLVVGLLFLLSIFQ